MNLYAASVPPALQALERGLGLLDLASMDLLKAQISPNMFDTTGQLHTVAGFALRATFPLTGQSVPELKFPQDINSLRPRFLQARTLIRGLDPASFTAQTITHRAGTANLTQSAAAYLHLFAIPNLWFHLSMAYATLRANGLPLGKADFDGLHSYPDRFSF